MNYKPRLIMCKDADANLEWLLANLPCAQDTYGPCTDNEYCTCGVLGRVVVDAPPAQGKGFGIHTVEKTGGVRQSGNLSIADAEACLTAKLAEVEPGGYDAFMDFSTGFWTANLDPYIESFTAKGVKIFPVEWEQASTTYYSFLVQVPGSMVVLELMSANQTALPSPRYASAFPRYAFPNGETPETTFFFDDERVGNTLVLGEGGATVLAAQQQQQPRLYAARVSHFSSSVARDRSYYESVLGATVVAASDNATDSDSGDGVLVVALTFAGLLGTSNNGSGGGGGSDDDDAVPAAPSYTQVHFIQRPPGNTTLAGIAATLAGRAVQSVDDRLGGSGGGVGGPPQELLPEVCSRLTVPVFEENLNACHAENVKSPTCGWDTWMDHHFSLGGESGRSMAEYVGALEDWVDPTTQQPLPAKYHVFGNKGGGVSFYALTPNGLSVQVTDPPYGDGWAPPSDLPGPAGDLCDDGCVGVGGGDDGHGTGMSISH